MAKKTDDPVAEDIVETMPEPAPEPVPFTVAPQQNLPPTTAQHDWLAKNPRYVRISHGIMGRFYQTGTLTPDGSFIPATQAPVMDGAGSFGVGVPIGK